MCVGQVLLAAPAMSQSVPAEVVADFDRLLRERALLDKVVAARIVAFNTEDPTRSGLRQTNRGIYVGLPLEDTTLDWLVKRELRTSRAVSAGVSYVLAVVLEEMKEDSARVALMEVNRRVVAGDLADRLLEQIRTENDRLQEIVRLNLGNQEAPVAALALRRLPGSPEYFRRILEMATIVADPWTCAAAAHHLSAEWRRREWWPTRGDDELLAAARPTSPFDPTLRSEAVAELQRRAPDTDWREIIFQEESAQLAGHLSDWLSDGRPWHPPPTELLVDVTLQATLDRGKEEWTLPSLLLQRALENEYLARDTISRHPESLVPGPYLLEIVATVQASPTFFLDILRRLDAKDQAPIVSVVLDRIRGRQEVDQWLATLRDDELEYVAANKSRAYSGWVASTAREFLDASGQGVPDPSEG